MNYARQVVDAPSKPVLLYDGDCRFCVLWVYRWMDITGEAVDYLPFQEERVARLFPELGREQMENAVQLVDVAGVIYQGAEAVFRCLASNTWWRWPLWLYQQSGLIARVTETGYRFVASHRTAFSRITRIFWGKQVERSQQFLVRRIFLGLLGLIYGLAFVSLWVQITGLCGRNGIVPAADLMSRAQVGMAADGTGLDRYRLLPTLCWWGTSDTFLQFQCAAGATLALLLLVGIAPPLCLGLMWLLHLSLATVCGDFLSFQWDNLLLETGFLAVFFAPFQILPKPSREKPPSRTALWLLRLLLFKLMFMSGAVKLASGDEVWRRLTALTRHYETQPLPTWVAWYAHQLPLWLQKASCALMFFIELAVPFLIFLPRRVRMSGALALAVLQFLILLTGNYTFFNWLTLLLCLLLLDDFVLEKLLPRNFTSLYSQTAKVVALSKTSRRLLAIAPIACCFISISTVQLLSSLRRVPRWTTPVVQFYEWLSPFRSINNYGLFAVMTMERPEIIIEGSDNLSDWKEYEFPYKPGDVNRRPAFVAPYQPRLDWQMWFAALGNYRQNPWFVNFCIRLLQGSPQVLALMKANPFPQHPPKYIRARFYDYQFTTRAERSRTGSWWKRQLKGEYLPPISLDMLRRVDAQ